MATRARNQNDSASVAIEQNGAAYDSSRYEKAPEMPMIDRIVMGPIKKYQKYNFFPWKMVIHIFLIIVCTAQVLLVVGSSGGYSRTDQNIFYTLFLDEEMELEDVDVQRVKYLYTIEDLQDQISTSFENYFGIEENPDDYFEDYELIEYAGFPDQEPKIQIVMDVFYLPGAKIDTDTDLRYSFTSMEDTGIFGDFSEEDRPELKALIRQLSNFRLTYQIRNRIPLNTLKNEECYNWIIYQNFDFSARNHPIASLQMDKTYCTDDKPAFGNFWGRYIWLHSLSIFLCSISLFLNIKYILNIISSFNSMKDKYRRRQKQRQDDHYKKHIRKLTKKNKSASQSDLNSRSSNAKFNTKVQSDRKSSVDKFQPIMDFDNEEYEDLPDWNQLTNKDKLKMFSSWSLIIIAADVLIIIGSVFLMLNTRTISQKGEIILGFGAMMTWISLMKFFENAKGYNVITQTVENVLNILLKVLAGFMPVFIGYGVLGMCIFWRSHRFSSLSTSMFSLFAVMNGDMIFDCWHDIDTVDYLLAQLYLYSFIFFSICVVLNVFIVVIEDGYIMQKFFNRTDWTKGVNQRSALHVAEMMMRENAIRRASGENLDDLDGDMSKSPSSKLQIPLINGAPIPHDGDPFIRMKKKTKKDIKSRKALIKMLKHEKAEIIYEKMLARIYQGDLAHQPQPSVRLPSERDSTRELHLIEENRAESARSLSIPHESDLQNMQDVNEMDEENNDPISEQNQQR